MRKAAALLCTLASFSSVASSNYQAVAVSDDWSVGLWTNPDTKERTCVVAPTTMNKRTIPAIVFIPKAPGGARANLIASGSFEGIGATYTVDNSSSVTVGLKNRKVPYGHLVTDHEYQLMLERFKDGLTVTYEVFSSNKFVEGGKRTMSLDGFRTAYELAQRCQWY
ncbi:hypothetical protein [Vibrio sp. THAF190c]|uniref:hypothetical protein n=1 Tax=Vibrio sp. THAF190c TaxID=2587865 RepID=UPI001268BAEB|nr:hypothetical protein [Vibrio sp. THAF190c]QFT13487.1 hypothetical protein FIV04_26390 [Vibrio sp. THAF190c]